MSEKLDKDELLRRGARVLRWGRLLLAFDSIVLGLQVAVTIWFFGQGKILPGLAIILAAILLLIGAVPLWLWICRFQKVHDELKRKEDA